MTDVEDLHNSIQEREKGSGAYGAVYKVSVNGMPCIAKRLHAIPTREVSRQEKDSIQAKFRNECIMLSKLQHPNIVHFVGVCCGKTVEELSLIMECLHTDLDEYLETKPNISLSDKRSMLRDVFNGLYLHTSHPSIIHRDLTSSNVLLTNGLQAKVIADLGTSKLPSTRRLAAHTQAKGPGHTEYMPPEMLKENPKCDSKLDIFSFGRLTILIISQEFPKVYEGSTTHAVLEQGNLQVFKCHKAPHEVGCNTYCRITFYDSVGLREYHSSSAGLLQNGTQTSTPIFYLVVGLSESNDNIKRSINWLSFLENRCTSVRRKPHFLVITIYFDALKSRREHKGKFFTSVLTTLELASRVISGFVAMGYQYVNSAGMRKLHQAFKTSCKSLLLQESITLASIQAQIEEDIIQGKASAVDVMSFLSANIPLLLYAICDQLKNPSAIENSCVIISKPALLEQVNGTVSAPEGLKEHIKLTLCTGTGPLSNIANHFVKHNQKMLVDFLSHLEFSYEIFDNDSSNVPSLQCNFFIRQNEICCGDKHRLVDVARTEVIGLIRCPKIKAKCHQLRSLLFQKMQAAARELCCKVSRVQSYVINPPEVTQYAAKPLSQLTQFSLESIASKRVQSASVKNSASKAASLDSLLALEPHADREEPLLSELFAVGSQKLSIAETIPVKTIETISNPSPTQLQESMSEAFGPDYHVLNVCRANCEGTDQYLPEKLDQFSMFAGRNPLEIVGVSCERNSQLTDGGAVDTPEIATAMEYVMSPADVDMLAELLSEVAAHWDHFLGHLGVPQHQQSGASRDNAKFKTKRCTALSMVVQLMQRNAFYFLLKFAVFVLQVQSCLGYLIELVNLFRLETALRLLLIMAGDVEPNPGPTDTRPTLAQLGVLPFENFAQIFLKFGMELGFAVNELAEIKCAHKNMQKQKVELFRRWLHREKKATWDTVLIALKKIGEADTARQICSVYDLTERHLELVNADGAVHNVTTPVSSKRITKAKTTHLARAGLKASGETATQSSGRGPSLIDLEVDVVLRHGSSSRSDSLSFHSCDEESTPSHETELTSQAFLRRQTAPVALDVRFQLEGNGTKQFHYNHESRPQLETSQVQVQGSQSLNQRFGTSQLESGQDGKLPEISKFRGEKTLPQKLLNAVKSDDPEAVQELVTQQGVSVEQPLTEGSTALLLACAENRKEVARVLLLELAAAIEAQDREGRTPLFSAVSNGNYEIAKLLLQRGARSDVRSKDGTPLLLPPAKRGFSIITEHLLENGCDPNLKDKAGMTPLIAATIKGQKDAVKVLLEHGADVSVTCLETSKTALQEAVELEHTELVTILIKATAAASAKNRELFTCHTVEGVRRLVKAGAKLDERRGGDGSTPLLLHAGTGNHDVVAELVRLRANVDLQDHAGVSALMKSATAGHLEIVQSLIVAGAVLDLKNKEGQTALMFAVRRNHFRVVKELLLAGANPNLKNVDGLSAAEMAAALNYKEISVLFDKQKTVGTKEDPFVSLLNNYLHSKGGPSDEPSPSLARRKVEPDSGVMVPQPTAASDDNALQTELSKSYKRIADLETRINDLTLQTTLEITDDSDLSYLDRPRLETEFRKQKDLKRKAETYAVEAKQSAQRLSAENYKLREDLSRERHNNELTRKNMLREMEQKMDKRANASDRVDAKLEVFNQEVSVRAHGLLMRSSQGMKRRQNIDLKFVKQFVLKERVRVNLIQLGFAGLPFSGKSTLVSQLLELSSSLDRHARRSIEGSASNASSSLLGLSHLECVILRRSGVCEWKHSTKYDARDIGFAWGLAQSLARNNQQPFLSEDPSGADPIFDDKTIDDFFKESFKKLCELFGTIQDDKKALESLTASSLTFANCLDVGVNRTAFEILPLLAGKCENVILLNVLSLKRDVKQLNKPPDLSAYEYDDRYSANRDGETLMKLNPCSEYYFQPILATNISYSKKDPKPANTVLVGTHADMLTQEHLEEAKKQVESSVQSLANQYQLSGAICPGVVDVDLTKDDDYLKVRSKVEEILEVNKQRFEVDLPLSWLFLRVVLYSKGDLFVSMESLKRTAKSCGIQDESEVLKFLEIFKNCGSLFSIGNFIVLDVFKFIEDLNKLYYIEQSQTPVPDRFREDVQNLSSGFLSKRLANHLWSEADESGRITAKVHIQLLKELEVLISIDGVPQSERKDKHYFMPSLRPDFDTRKLKFDSNSLYVMYDSGLVTCHKQTQFVKHLRHLSPGLRLEKNFVYNATLFKWSDGPDRPKDKEIYVKVVFGHNFLEVDVEIPEGQIPPTKLYAQLKSACVKIFHKMKSEVPALAYSLAIVSPGCEGSSSREAHPHLLTFSPASATKSLVCKDCRKKFSVSDIPSERRLWIQSEYSGPPSKLQDVLDVGELHKFAALLSHLSAEKIQAFARELEISDTELSNVAAHSSVQDLIFHLLYEWRQQRMSSASVEQLGEALLRCSCYNEAVQLYSGAIAQPSASQPSTPPPGALPKEVSAKELTCLANHLSETLWKQLGAVLGAPLKEGGGGGGGGGHKSVSAREKCLRMLKEWQEKDEDPRKSLVYGLESLQHYALAHAIKTGAWKCARFT